MARLGASPIVNMGSKKGMQWDPFFLRQAKDDKIKEYCRLLKINISIKADDLIRPDVWRKNYRVQSRGHESQKPARLRR